ncbi:hypothetical protein K5E40_27905 [Pseudomonas baetica]|uniref:hypothetical protein n=1 Tax=Pseudomonas baetica TaxID=674054 RepID=UPI001C8BEC76|nr:hypothetical protein [Pseudomonas baetica]MBX9409487.1 hypothetical protein [Pseudomonas baetica]
MTTDQDVAERDITLPLLVVDGPYRGQRMARDGVEFTEVITFALAQTKGIITYQLGKTKMLGFVWELKRPMKPKAGKKKKR